MPPVSFGLERLIRLGLAVLGGLLFALAARAAEPLPVVASFSILGDFVTRVGGERVQVSTLVGPGSDGHVYQPTPADAKRLTQARLVVVNGLGFEGWINRLIKSSGYKGTVVVASKGSELLERRPAKAASQDKGHERHHHHGTRDPHAWQDVSNALRYVDTIAQALSSVDPEGRAHYMENARRYREELAALDTELKTAFQALPAERRSVVTPHDAFAYFARAYGLRFVAPRGVSNETEPSAADVARVIQLVKRENIPAVFVESITDARLIERIRQESGARVGGTLYSDALTGKDGPAPNYVAMMRHNATTLLAALRP